ncbi:MAG: biopolymer transporter ExbD [Bacteroidia bacterium]|nr:biopolymer transporter ExbD [Bacteroidia bacterium]
MADVDAGGGGGKPKKGGPKTKKKSTRIDMTAMVDVAFLLLTFFVLTATMKDDVAMDMVMPPKIDDPEDLKEIYKKVVEDKIMTIVLDTGDVVKYYVGITDVKVQKTDFSKDGVRKALLMHLNYGKSVGKPRCDEVNDAEGCWDPIFVLKPKKNSRYKNLVDVLDELAITQAPKYAIDKFTPDDSTVIATAEEKAAAEAAGGGTQ